jgi:hypothetical protein
MKKINKKSVLFGLVLLFPIASAFSATTHIDYRSGVGVQSNGHHYNYNNAGYHYNGGHHYNNSGYHYNGAHHYNSGYPEYRYHNRDHHHRPCTRNVCQRRCHWDSFERGKRCRVYCRPVVRRNCW